MMDQRSRIDTEAVGRSEAYLALQERISAAARASRPVILVGERGTGKELAAQRLHLLSPRWNQPYITLNCAALSPSLIESELFGHEAGAFTGAIRQRKGRFELADGGTLFLDEAANIPLSAQEKILRAVEYGEIERIGAMRTLRLDARLIAATNIDLREAAREGAFRADLLDRLAFEVITLPPLRERGGDILLLAEHFARRMAGELGLGAPPDFTARARQALIDYDWPGNVRELKNVVERMVYRANGAPIDHIQFDPFESPFRPAAAKPEGPARQPEASVAPAAAPAPAERDWAWAEALDTLPLADAARALELRRLRQALEQSRFNQRAAAEALGLTYHQFRGYYRKYKDDIESSE
ncbi:MAG: Psp operon transcriptional activator [candidate division BRC1 bacterium ADurb.BinA364]|nr:MAG: Psp operon transcriptional activator [candidate division BRC1 bacterium ADurb.BinA364]